MAEKEKDPYAIDWFRTIGGVFAAVSSAVLLSTLGAVGTIVGAAVGSLVISVGGSLYAAALARSRERVAAQAAAMRRMGVAQAEVRRARRQDDEDVAEAHLEYADRQLREARVELREEPAAAGPSWLAELPWRRIGLVTAGIFVAAAVLITAFELIAGRPVSDYTGGSDDDGGTSWTRLGGGPKERASEGPTESPDASPTWTPTGSPSPSDTATPAEPTPTATPTETVPTAPPPTTAVPTPTPTAPAS